MCVTEVTPAMLHWIDRAGERGNTIHISSAHGVKRDSCLKVGQEANFQQVQEKVLVFNAINAVQEQDHSCLVVRAEHRGQVRLDRWTLCTNTWGDRRVKGTL